MLPCCDTAEILLILLGSLSREADSFSRHVLQLNSSFDHVFPLLSPTWEQLKRRAWEPLPTWRTTLQEMPLKVGQFSVTGTSHCCPLVGGGLGILFCEEMLCPAQQLCSSPCSWQSRAIHTWDVPTYSFQGAAAPHPPDFPLRWSKSRCLFVQLQNQGVLQAGKADGQSWDVLGPEELLRLSRGRPCAHT